MSITLALSDEVVAALRTRSESEGRPIEAVLADLVRSELTGPPHDADAPKTTAALTRRLQLQSAQDEDDRVVALANGDMRDGIRLLPARPDTPVVTHDHVQRMMDEAE